MDGDGLAQQCLTNPRAARLRIKGERCERDLLYFVRSFWSILEPAKSNAFVDGWVLGAIADHLMAVTDGQIRRLLINVPPGFTKSLMTDVFWPAWEWGPCDRPAERYIAASYAAHLTTRDNRRFLALAQCPEYREIWGGRFEITRDGEGLISNDKTGWKIATSVGGVGTGERGSRIIIDDPNNPIDVESDLVRNRTIIWFKEVMQDRLNNVMLDPMIVIQQRTHNLDVSGVVKELMEKGGEDWVHLSIPNEYEPDRHCGYGRGTPLQWEDPRGCDDDGKLLPGLRAPGEPVVPGSPIAARAGELAWPERMSAEATARMKIAKDAFAYAGQYQQLPVPRGGGLIQREWWRLWSNKQYPGLTHVIASLDTAQKENELNDYNALTVWGVFEGPSGEPLVLMIDAWHARLPLGALVERVAASCKKHGVRTLLIEDKTRGYDVANEIVAQYGKRQWTTILRKPMRDKVSRVITCQEFWSGPVKTLDVKSGIATYMGGVIFAPDTVWAEEVMDECQHFPRGAHDDYVDTATQALIYMRQTGILQYRAEFIDYERQARKLKKPSKLPYDV